MESLSMGPGKAKSAARIAYLCSDSTRRLPAQLRTNTTVYGFRDAAQINPHSFDEIWVAAPQRMDRHTRRVQSIEAPLKTLLLRDTSYAANVVLIHPTRTQAWMWANPLACNHYLVAGCRFSRNNCREVLVRSRFPLLH